MFINSLTETTDLTSNDERTDSTSLVLGSLASQEANVACDSTDTSPTAANFLNPPEPPRAPPVLAFPKIPSLKELIELKRQLEKKKDVDGIFDASSDHLGMR